MAAYVPTSKAFVYVCVCVILSVCVCVLVFGCAGEFVCVFLCVCLFFVSTCVCQFSISLRFWMLDLDVIHQSAIKLLQQMVGACDADEATRRKVHGGGAFLGNRVTAVFRLPSIQVASGYPNTLWARTSKNTD